MRPTVEDIAEILTFFAPHCREKSTFSELQVMAANPSEWSRGHALFCRIRDKTLKADDSGDELLQHQYSLEEICAKTLYNMSEPQEPFSMRHPAPFDQDSPDYVGMIAQHLALYLGLAAPTCITKLIPA